MLPSTLIMLEGTLTNPSANDNRNKDFQDQLLGMLQVILVKVGSSIDKETGEKIVKLLIWIFQSIKKVTENGLFAYSGLCNGMGRMVNVDDFGQYILWALDGQDEECIRVACGLVSDIAGALGEAVNQYLTTFVPHLLKILRSGDRDRKTKL